MLCLQYEIVTFLIEKIKKGAGFPRAYCFANLLGFLNSNDLLAIVVSAFWANTMSPDGGATMWAGH
jgi:hypothetical protein